MRDEARDEWVTLYRQYLEKRGHFAQRECPDFEDIHRFFERRTARKQKFKILHHILFCDPCRRDFEWMNELHRRIGHFSQDFIDLKQQRSLRRRFIQLSDRRMSVPFALASLAIVVIIGGICLLGPLGRSQKGGPPVYRDSGQVQFYDIYPRHRTVLPRTDVFFCWKSFLTGPASIVELFDPAMALLWRSPKSAKSKVQVPSAVLRSLTDGRDYYWSISLIDDDGNVVDSPLFSFQIAR